MLNREELDKFIESALSDNELTPRKMGMLIQKAKDLGINENEFIIELDARMYTIKEKKKRKDISKIPNLSKKVGFKKSIILIISFSIIILGLLLYREYKATQFREIKRVERKFYKSIENKEFIKAYEYLNEIKVLTPDYDHFDYHKKLLDIRIPYLLENNAWEVAFSELKELSNLSGSSQEYYYQEMLLLIANHELKNNNFNHVTQILDYLFIWVSDGSFNKEVFFEFMKSSLSYLISQSQYLEALSLINYYPMPNFEMNADYYNNSHDYYNNEALVVNDAVQILLNKLLLNNVRGFPYPELINLYKPIIKKGEFIGKKVLTNRRLKAGKTAYDKDNWEYFQETIDLYKFYPIIDYKLNAIKRIKAIGIDLK